MNSNQSIARNFSYDYVVWAKTEQRSGSVRGWYVEQRSAGFRSKCILYGSPTLIKEERKRDYTMRNRKNKTQRQEVRRVLAAMRQELKDYSLRYEDMPDNRPVVHLNEVIHRARRSAEERI